MDKSEGKFNKIQDLSNETILFKIIQYFSRNSRFLQKKLRSFKKKQDFSIKIEIYQEEIKMFQDKSRLFKNESRLFNQNQDCSINIQCF